MDYDFCGYVTKNNIKCTDGLVILQNAFEHNDGCTVPMVWMHDHSDPTNTIGHMDLENRDDGVFGYGHFNKSQKAASAKAAVENGDIVSMSIFAGHVKKNGNYVLHGDIKEVSLVLAGANPGARIENVIRHSEDDEEYECDMYLDIGEGIGFIRHDDSSESVGDTGLKEGQDDSDTLNQEDQEDSDTLEHEDSEETVMDIVNTMNEKQKKVLMFLIQKAREKSSVVEHSDSSSSDDVDNETVEDIVKTMNEKQKKAMEFLIGAAALEAKNQNGGNKEMEVKHNVFENDGGVYEAAPICHADQEMILKNAQKSGVGTFQAALRNYLADHEEYSDIIEHGFSDVTQLFPEPHDVMPGAPEAIPEDVAWVKTVMNGTTKSPFTRIRTRQADISAIKALGYKTKGTKKKDMGNVSLVTRTTDPQTIYIKDKLNRDDIVDITDFDVVAYMHGIMRQALDEEIATAILLGDGREPGAEDKIEETHIRSIWHDDDLYAIHHTVDFAGMKASLQGTNTAANFGDEYVRAEAIIAAALYSRENYKGRGKPAFFAEPHLINTMLLARDMNGRRVYNTISDLTAALNVSAIHTVEPMANKTRTTSDEGPKTMKLLGIFVNMADYQLGATKGGQVTSFNDFDIDYNQEKFLQEARLSGALTRVKSAIVLEEDVTVDADPL